MPCGLTARRMIGIRICICIDIGTGRISILSGSVGTLIALAFSFPCRVGVWVAMPVLVAEVLVNNADYFVIAGLPLDVNKLIKDFVMTGCVENRWMLNVEDFVWRPLELPPPFRRGLVDRIKNADMVRSQRFPSLKITTKISYFSYRRGERNRRRGIFFIL